MEQARQTTRQEEGIMNDEKDIDALAMTLARHAFEAGAPLELWASLVCRHEVWSIVYLGHRAS